MPYQPAFARIIYKDGDKDKGVSSIKVRYRFVIVPAYQHRTITLLTHERGQSSAVATAIFLIVGIVHRGRKLQRRTLERFMFISYGVLSRYKSVAIVEISKD